MPITEFELANGRRVPVKCSMSIGKTFIGEGLEHLPYSSDPLASVIQYFGEDGKPIAIKRMGFSQHRLEDDHDTISFKFHGELE